MRRFWNAVARVTGRRSGLVLGVVAAVAIVLAGGLPRLDFATGQDSYLNDDDQIAIDNEEYQRLFGGQAMLVLFTAEQGGTVLDLLAGENLAQLTEVTDELRSGPGVQNVVSPLTALEFTDALVEGGTAGAAGQIITRAISRESEEGRPEAADARLADAQVTLARSGAVPPEQQTLDNPRWIEFLLFDNTGFSLAADGTLIEPPEPERVVRSALRPFFPFPPGVEPTQANATHAQIVVRLTGNASLDEEGAAAVFTEDAMAEREFPGFDVLTTGAPVLLKEINDYLQGGMLTLGGIAVVVMLVVLLTVFRVRWRLLPLGAVLVGIICAFGILGYGGFQLSLVTISGLPILIGMGIDYAIQVQARVEEEVIVESSDDPLAAVARNLGPPMVISVIAAVLAFAALRWSAVPMVRDFSVLLAVGILVILTIDIAVPLAALAARERRRPTTTARSETALARAVVRLGGLPAKTVGPLIVVAVVLFGFGLTAEDAFTIQTDPEKWVDQSSAVIADLETLKAETGSSSELGYFIIAEDGVFTDETAAFIGGFARDATEAHPDGLLTASSLATTVTLLLDVPGLDSPLLPTGADLELAFDVAPPDVRSSVVSEDGTAANLVFRTGPSGLEERKALIEQLADELDPPEGVRATASGLAVVGVGLLENLEKNRAELTYIALGLVSLWLIFRLMSIPNALVTLIPVLMAVGASSLVIAAAGFELSPMTTISGPLVIANCAEFCILITGRYFEERRSGRSPRESGDRAAARTGEAFVASALTTIGGFAVLMFSALPLLRDFGAIVTLNVGVALLSALVVLPPILLWTDHKGLLRATRDLPGE